MQRAIWGSKENTLENMRVAAFVFAGALVLVPVALGVRVMKATAQEKTQALPANASQTKIAVLPVEGMTCVSCVARIKKTLHAIDGVKDAEVSLETRSVKIRYDGKKVSPEKLSDSVSALGYKVE